MGLLGLAGSLLGMIPKVGSPSGAKKGKSGGSKGKSSKKSSKKKSSTKKKQKKSSKKKKKKKRKKKKKKWGKFFTKARKLKNSLSKSKLVKRAKKAIKKAILTTKKVVKKAKAAVTKAKQQVKAAVKQTKQVVKEKVLPVVKKAAQATTKAVKNAVKPKNLLNTLQVGLDLVGLIPGFGEIADGVNGIIYLARGDKVNAALSFGAMIPFAGWAATGGKLVNKGAGVVKSVAEGVQNVLKGPVGSVVDQVKKQVVNVKTQIQSKVAEVKQQLRQMVQSQQHEFSFAGIKIEDTGTVGRNTPTPSPKPSNTQPSQNGSNKKPAEDKGTGKTTFSEKSLNHANEGDFTRNPKTGEISKMSGGGHGQDNIEFLKQNGMEYNIEKTYPNGVRVGNVPDHKSKGKRTGTGQAWFPENWSKEDIRKAGEYVTNMPEHKNIADGVTVFGDYNGVRVGVIKTNGEIGTIFPDSMLQP